MLVEAVGQWFDLVRICLIEFIFSPMHMEDVATDCVGTWSIDMGPAEEDCAYTVA